MKIHTPTSNSIKLVINFWFLQVLGFLIFLGSLFVFAYTQLQYSIVCQEKQPNLARQCTLETNLYSIYHSRVELGVLSNAVVMSRAGSKGGQTYWVSLLTENGVIPLTGGTSSGRTNKDAAAQAINDYINKSSNTQLVIPYGTPWWVYLLAGLFSIMGISLMLGFRSTVIDFNRVLKVVAIKRKGFTGTKETKLLFSQIEKIIIEESRSQNVSRYRLAFLLNEKSSIPFVRTYDSNLSKKEQVAKQLNDFIATSNS